MDTTIPYEQRRNPNLPWGYWARDVRNLRSGDPLEDEEGRPWGSVREMFWVGHLGLPRSSAERTIHRGLEFILAVLVAIDRRIIGTEERVRDLCDGSWEACSMVM